MSTELRHYLDNIRTNLKLDPSLEKEVLRELYTHLEEEIAELKETGLSDEEAAKATIKHFGLPKAVAGGLNQVHNSSNWSQAIVAALPHLLLALLFALHQWHNVAWLVAILISIIGVVIYGWQHNKPAWFFTWLGYALVPLLVIGFILAILLGQALSLIPTNNLTPSWWVWLAALVYFPFILWLLIPIALQTIRRDWLFGSLMALPIPAIAGWFLAVQHEGNLPEYNQYLYKLAPWIALSFAILAAIVILFVQLGQRSLKAGVLLTAGLIILIACSTAGNIDFSNLALLALVTLILLLGPALLGHKMEQRENKTRDYLLVEQNLLK
ncbi:MAG TPA: permease prefix domain 1-containing protein [Dehalococcoidia bacterium]|nr:permease prefix domain 1-containing protein [Dehalococcoidia bacterium]